MQAIALGGLCPWLRPQGSFLPTHIGRPSALAQPPAWCLGSSTRPRDVTTRFVPTTRPDTIGAPEAVEELLVVPEAAPAFAAQDWAAAFVSQRGEFDYWVDEVEGTLPDFLRGTLFRNGPGNFERGAERYKHMLDGDGYVSSFAFGPGNRVHFRSRYVRTREFQKEDAAEAIRYRNTFGTQRAGGAIANAFDIRLKNPANTNVIEWGGRLLSLWEAGPPYELDPHTLETVAGGPATLDGLVIDGKAPSSTNSWILDTALGLGSAMTAHPHVLPAGEGSPQRMVTWVWRSMIKPFGDADMQISLVEYDAAWRQLGAARFTMPHSFFNPHDFAITPSHYIFFQNAMSFEMTPYLLGAKGPAQCIHFTSQPMKVHLVPRAGGPPQVRASFQLLDEVFRTESTFTIHHANAFEDPNTPGDVLVWSSGWGPATLKAVAARAKAAKEKLGMLGDWGQVENGDFSRIPFTALWCHRISTSTGEVTRTVLYEAGNMDHPKVNPHFYSRPSRYAWFNGAAGPPAVAGASGPPQAFMRLDTATGKTQTWAPGARCFCEELIFVPGPEGASKEDDGALLGMVFDAESQRSSLVVLDAADLAKGPIARIPLRHHVPHGLHGYYSEAYFGPGSADAEEAPREEPPPPPAACSPGQQLHNNAQVLPRSFWKLPRLGKQPKQAAAPLRK